MKGTSEKYIVNARIYMGHLAQFTDGKPWLELERTDLERWFAELARNGTAGTRGLAESTLISVKSKLTTFLRYLNDGDTPKVVRNFKTPWKTHSRVRNADQLLTDADIETVADRLNPKWKVAWLLTANTGMRPGETLHLKGGDIEGPKSDASGREHIDVHIRDSKTGDSRTVPVYDPKTIRLASDLAGRVGRGGLLFPDTNAGGKPTGSGIFSRIVRTASAGMDKRIYPYLCRHSFATRLIAKGWSDQAVMRLTGHADPHMLRTYTHLSVDDLRDALAEATAAPATEPGLVDKIVRDKVREVEKRFEKRMRRVEKIMELIDSTDSEVVKEVLRDALQEEKTGRDSGILKDEEE